jgi:hypothetical protein
MLFSIVIGELLQIFKKSRQIGKKVIEALPREQYILIMDVNGRQQRCKLTKGSSYLAQSSRILNLNTETKRLFFMIQKELHGGLEW